MLVVTLFLFVDFSFFFVEDYPVGEIEGGRGGWKLDLISRSLDRWIHLCLSIYLSIISHVLSATIPWN